MGKPSASFSIFFLFNIYRENRKLEKILEKHFYHKRLWKIYIFSKSKIVKIKLSITHYSEIIQTQLLNSMKVSRRYARFFFMFLVKFKLEKFSRSKSFEIEKEKKKEKEKYSQCWQIDWISYRRCIYNSWHQQYTIYVATQGATHIHSNSICSIKLAKTSTN